MFERLKAAADAFWRAGDAKDAHKEALVRSERADVPLDLYTDIQKFSQNPDALLDDLNKEEDLYREMMRDGVVKTSINRKIVAVISQDFVVQSQDENDEDQKKCAEFIDWTLRNFQPHPDRHKLSISSFRTSLLQICDAVPSGYSVSEVLLGPIQDSVYRGRVGIVAIKGKDPADLKMKFDPYLNILHLTNTADGKTERLNPRKFVVFPWMEKYANAYGTSDLQAAYRPWYLKKILFRVWAVALEKYAMPTVLGKHPVNWKKAQIDALESAIRKIQQDNAITMQEDGSIEFLENAISGNTKVFEDAINALDKQILIAIEGASMHIIESRLTGSRNVGLVSADQADLFVWFLSRAVEEIINDQLIPKLMAANFKGVACPRFQFVDPGDKDLVKDSQIDTALANLGVPLPLSYFYEKYGRPEPKQGDELLTPPAAAAGGAQESAPLFQIPTVPDTHKRNGDINGR